MAKNIHFETNDQLSVRCNDPATPKSGDPVLFGDRVGVALMDERADGTTTVKWHVTPDFPVKGVNGSGNSAVAEGDVLYYVAGDTPAISKKVTGVRAGIALGAVAAGATTTIPVRLG